MDQDTIHDREAILRITSKAIDILNRRFHSAQGTEVVALAEQLREMARLHMELQENEVGKPEG
ncbi:MAG: hypothetical protein QHH04_01005 [Methanolinea sp.]|jgi:hypothetical protein|nr:hypothetical protein [Methanolinea sp.]